MRTLESLDHKGGGRGDDGDGSLTVLDRELHSNAQTLPCGGRLSDIFSDLLGRLFNV